MAPIGEKRIPVIAACVAGAVMLLALWGIYTSEGATRARERDARLAAAVGEAGEPTQHRIEIAVAEVRREPAPEVIELSGALEPVRGTWVAAELAGRVVEVPAAEHAPIERDDVLVRLDEALPRAELIRAEASHALAQAERERQERLGQRSVASTAELDRAVAEERRAWASVLEARTRLDRTRVTAPFAGLVNSLDLDPGAHVQPGTPVAEVLDVSSLELEVFVSDRQVGALEPGSTVRVRVDALGSQLFTGRIARVARAPETETQRFPVVVTLGNETGTLLPGMLARVELAVGAAPAIRIPARAVVREFELNYVFVVEADARVRQQRVDTRSVAFRPDLVEVSEGLQPGQRIAVSRVAQLRDGAPVRVP